MFPFLLTCWIWSGPTYLDFSFLDMFKRLMFSVERRTFWLAERSGGTDLFLLACFAYLALEEFRLQKVPR